MPNLTEANEARWSAAAIKPSQTKAFAAVAKRLVAKKPDYVVAESATGVPWFVIAVIHEREASQRFDRSIAQGDPWNRVSTHVPRGRGPFKSWYEAAIDALTNCAPYAAKWSDWSAGGTLTLLEHYNGLGYYKRGLPSPYIWAGTNQYTRGKYVADGRFDPNQVDSQLGCAGLILAMAKLDEAVSFETPHALMSPPVEADDPASDSQAVAPEVEDDEKAAAPVTPPPPPPINVQAPTAHYSFDVELLQRKLVKMNYHEIGEIDGLWGGKTRGAVTAFMNDRGQPTDGNYTPEVTAEIDKAIAEKWTRPIAPARAFATAKDIAPKVEAVRVTLWQRMGAKITAGAAGLGLTGTSLSSTFDTVREKTQPIHDAFSKVPPEIWFLLMGAVAGLVWYFTNRAAQAATKDFNTGRLN